MGQMNGSIPKPNYFRLLRGLCIVLSSVGLFGSMLLFFLASVPPFKTYFASVVQPLSFLSILDFVISVAFFVAAVWLSKLRETGRWLIVICAGLEIVIFLYRIIINFRDVLENYSALLVGIIFCILDLFILLYFRRQDVRAYINNTSS